MNLFLTLAALLFYTKATETKECPKYVLTEEADGLEELKSACDALNGKIASEDLKDSENSKAAKVVVDEFRVKDGETLIFLGITVRNPEQTPDMDTNPFVFSDGTDSNDAALFEWAEEEPTYDEEAKCAGFLDHTSQIYELECDDAGRTLCFVDCPNSGSERSRKNFSLFALFVAGSVFNAFHSGLGL